MPTPNDLLSKELRDPEPEPFWTLTSVLIWAGFALLLLAVWE